ncbi:hypothetical protein HRR99_07035 [Agrobacterium vaccinii]|uniref:hypothetical protein n=1 Tax=Agrobacterium vaccinii TaxID=2735528 RepID=UPI001E5DAFCA|nr:hypothetical protein [Agrobacterium vaccinii]UHS61283.1 hypothetical protein HRR99_07035 [Agrobacterium vaccinii]
MKGCSWILMAAALLLPISSAQAACFDVSKGQPSSLTGHLTHHIFAGPPNFENVQKGDTPEPGYVLKLDHPICITGDEFADPDRMFDEVQLVPGNTSKDMSRLRNTDVYVDVMDPMPAKTGHHHRPLVVWVKSISSSRDITLSYGTAATTVEAFYAALRSGDGKLAASFVVPEKTEKGPFSPQALTAFYGSLFEPISLIYIKRSQDDRFRVRDHFRGGAKACDGVATVTTVKRHGRDFIAAIRAESGC